MNIIFLNTYTESYLPISLDIISFISVVFAISVIIIKNPISSILCLIALFFCIASYLSLLGMTFIGLSYLLVYVGAISILFLFILMLINIRVSEVSVNTTNSIPLVVIVSLFFFLVLNKILPADSVFVMSRTYNNVSPYFTYFIDLFNYNTTIDNDIYYTNSNSWDTNIAESTHITSIGNVMYTTYFIWLIVTSIVLLLAMVGCIVITIKDNVSLSKKNTISHINKWWKI